MTNEQSFEVVTRYARLEDAEQIGSNHHEAWVQAYRGTISDDDLASLVKEERQAKWKQWLDPEATWNRPLTSVPSTTVATIAGEVVAHLTVQADEIAMLYVHPDRWRAGIGSHLLEIGERIIANAGHSMAKLFVLEVNQRAIGMYESRGWHLGTETKVDSLWGIELKSIVMTKELAKPHSSHILANRSVWDDNAEQYVAAGRASWSANEPRWGIYAIPDSIAGVMPDVAGKDVVELGCGTAYVSAWALRAGARTAVGIDNSPEQLRTATRLQSEFNLNFPLLFADAENVPLQDASFDVVISEYGAAIWCDPYRWIAEASRLLRPGGQLVFLGNSVLQVLAVNDFESVPIDASLQRAQRGMFRVLWPDSDGVEFHLSHGERIRLLRAEGFDVVDLIELYPPPASDTRYKWANTEWAEHWPTEEVWVAELR